MMSRWRLRWLVAAPLAVVFAAGIFAVSWQTSRLTRELYSSQIRSELASGCALVEKALGHALETGDRRIVDPLTKRLGQDAGRRVTVIAPDGTVLGESEEDPALMDNHAGRPEVAAALRGNLGTAVRYSDTLGADMMYSARAVHRDGKLWGVVRTGVALSSIEAVEATLFRRAAWSAAVVAFLAMVCGFWVVHRVTLPLETLEGMADGWSRGEMERDLPVGGSVEVQRVAAAMRRMAEELDRRIATLVKERNEQNAVLSAMVEGVFAIDAGGRVMAVNEAGARLLKVHASEAIGRTIEEVAQNADLQRLVADSLRADSVLERDIAVRDIAARGAEERLLQAHGAPVRDADGGRLGAVIVLNDVTRLRRLETVRQDFVANVSHELKTPVTSIKGFLETLLGGAMNDPVDAKRFLEIAARQTDRLGAIIEDLLELSRIDQDSDYRLIEKAATDVDAVVAGAIDVCRAKAEGKQVRLDVRCEQGLSAKLNGALVEQALVNLIDNAIKYTDAQTTVEVSATREQDSVVFAVRDHGAGIDAEHLPRLFERFYRVGKARSRSVGGTGLGLSIVKHIVQAQGGRVDVQSKPGHGSVFTLRFPLA